MKAVKVDPARLYGLPVVLPALSAALRGPVSLAAAEDVLLALGILTVDGQRYGVQAVSVGRDVETGWGVLVVQVINRVTGERVTLYVDA